MIKPVVTADFTKGGKSGALKALVEFEAQNIRPVTENSQFFGLFQPDDYTAFVEFDICHSMPVIAGPAYQTGNYTCLHPATNAKSHRGLLHKQTNLHHLIKAYDEDNISRDRIVGAVVMTSFPAMPEGGWQIPKDKSEAIPIHVCAAIFKQAEGALEMLSDHQSGRQKWSVSIEMEGNSFEEMAVYFPNQNKLIPLLEVPQEIMSKAVTKDEDGRFCFGKYQGEQLVLCYGGEGGTVIFRGVGFTPSPAEKEAAITRISLASEMPEQATEYELEEKPGGIMAMVASSANDAIARAAIQRNFPGATFVKLHMAGEARLKDQTWKLDASAEKPVVEFTNRNRQRVLRYLCELMT